MKTSFFIMCCFIFFCATLAPVTGYCKFKTGDTPEQVDAYWEHQQRDVRIRCRDALDAYSEDHTEVHLESVMHAFESYISSYIREQLRDESYNMSIDHKTIHIGVRKHNYEHICRMLGGSPHIGSNSCNIQFNEIVEVIVSSD